MHEIERRFFPNDDARTWPEFLKHHDRHNTIRIEQAYIPRFRILRDHKTLQLPDRTKVRCPYTIPKDAQINTFRIRESIYFQNGVEEIRHQITLKGPKNAEGMGVEIEWDIADTHPIIAIADASPWKITKTRYTHPLTINGKDYHAEIDLFLPKNGKAHPPVRCIIEVENLPMNAKFLPEWFGEEITSSNKWSNLRLARTQ